MQENEETPPKSVPAYGSQEYWEQRYQKDETNQNDNNNGDNPDPYHSWYFSFEELKPILLPLILGREDSEEEEEEEEEENDNNDPDDSEENEAVEGTDEAEEEGAKGTGKAKASNEEIKQSKPQKDDNENDDSDDNDDKDDDDDDEWEEVQEGDAEEELGDEQPMVAREGLAVNGPIQVLELGCGDVPLGTALAEELQVFQTATGASALEICQKIACTDYSPTVIEKMKRSHEKKRKQDDTESMSIVPVEFTVADARKLPYEDSSFQLILEKGTMDAMLSDDKEGVSNCVQIVAECARLLTEGGCFFLVSHINAQTTKGEEWLERVVLVGLRKGGPDSSWAIEAHGSDHSGAEEENAAPAVYLIFKRKRQANDQDKSNSKIPLQFFSY